MSTRQELLAVIEQLPDEQLPSLLEVAQSLSEKNYALDRRAFLRLPADERDSLLAKQVEAAAKYFRPGSEAMEWVEDYLEDENWDDEAETRAESAGLFRQDGLTGALRRSETQR